MRRRTFLQTLAVAAAVPWTRFLAPGMREPLVPPLLLWTITKVDMDAKKIELAFTNDATRVAYAFGAEMMLEDLMERSDG